MIGLGIESAPLDRLRSRFHEAPAIVSQEIHSGLERSLEVTVGEVRKRTPGQHLPGAIQGEVSGSGAFQSARVFVADGRYQEVARWMEEGTRAHVIEPRFARVLRWQAAGGARFAMRVHHPGTRPYRMFSDGFDAAKPQIRRIFSFRLGTVTIRLRGRG